MDELHLERKLCKGPLHPEGKLVPLDDFYKRWRVRPNRRPRWEIHYICKPCQNYKDKEKRQKTGIKRNGKLVVSNPDFELVPLHKYMWAFEEVVRRVGRVEASRRSGISRATIGPIMDGKRKQIRKSSAKKILQTLAEVRMEGIVRHKDSIHHGSYLRGREEKVPKGRRDFYVNHGDNETENKRVARKS